jgi:hypothetical protein
VTTCQDREPFDWTRPTQEAMDSVLSAVTSPAPVLPRDQFRLIDLMCDRHRTLILDTRIWPPNYQAGNHNPGNNSCDDCGAVGGRMPTGRATILPGVNQREQAAVHEAGHAVAYLLHGFRVQYAALEPGDAAGSDAYINVEDVPGRRGMKTRLIGLWAGQSASLRLMQHMAMVDDANTVDIVATSALDGHDILAARRSARTVLAARRRADTLIDRHWPTVRRIADALFIRGRLTGDEMAEVCDARS